MESTDKNERLKPGNECGEDLNKSKINQDIEALQTSVAFLNEEIDKIKIGIPSEHFNPEEMLENNLTTWDATKQKLVTPTDPTSVKVGTEHLATEMDLFNTVHDVIDGTTPVGVVKVGALDSEGSVLLTNKSIENTLADYAKITDVDEETKNRQIADNNIINGTTPIKVIDNEATNILGNKVATYDKAITDGIVEYRNGLLVKSETDISADLTKEINNRKDSDVIINDNISALKSRMLTEESKLASESDERKMMDEALMDSVNGLYDDISVLRVSMNTNASDISKIKDGTDPIYKIAAGATDTEGNVLATSDDAFMLYGAQGRDNVPEQTDLDEIVLCGQKSVNSDALAKTITGKPNGENGPFDLIVGYFNADNKQPYQVYIGKASNNVYFRFTIDGSYEISWHKISTTTV